MQKDLIYTFVSELEKSSKKIVMHFLDAKESNKSAEEKNKIETLLFENGFSRKDLIVAIGGGITSDLAGCVAANYKRGMNWMILPTTILSMVDASIGGKVGINTIYGKNTLGFFHLPLLIITELRFLSSLPQKEFKSGLSEWIKSLLLSQNIDFESTIKSFNMITLDSDNTIKIDNFKDLENLMLISQKQKWETVIQDFEETKGIREILNYGHTLAHAIENSSNYQISHGEAVAIGIQFANYISFKKGFMFESDFNNIFNHFYKLKLLNEINKNKIDEMIELMKNDKKNKDDIINFILLEKPGKLRKFNNTYLTPFESFKVKDYLQDFIDFYNSKIY